MSTIFMVSESRNKSDGIRLVTNLTDKMDSDLCIYYT